MTVLAPSGFARGKARASGRATCDGCSRVYRDYPSRIAKAIRHYCSLACYRASRTGDRNPKWRGGLTARTCAHCAKSFSTLAAHVARGRGRFCSPACKKDGSRKYPTKAIMQRESGRRREARERAARSIATHTYSEWLAVLNRHGNLCAHCGCGGKLTRDHINPLSKGGDDSISNIQPLCHRCNARKGNRI